MGRRSTRLYTDLLFGLMPVWLLTTGFFHFVEQVWHRLSSWWVSGFMCVCWFEIYEMGNKEHPFISLCVKLIIKSMMLTPPKKNKLCINIWHVSQRRLGDCQCTMHHGSSWYSNVNELYRFLSLAATSNMTKNINMKTEHTLENIHN